LVIIDPPQKTRGLSLPYCLNEGKPLPLPFKNFLRIDEQAAEKPL
jgi:hypothetical protein